MLVFNIQHFSTYDGPGLRTVIFFKGCPLNCAWCHNPEGKGFLPELSFDAARCIGCRKCAVCPEQAHEFAPTHIFKREKCSLCGKCVSVCPTGALEIIGKDYTVDALLQEVKKDAVFYGAEGGVTLSGGEPFAQPEGLMELLPALKRAGIHTAIETSGCVSSEQLEQAAKHTDLFLYDFKLADELCKPYIGVAPEKLLAGLAVLDRSDASVLLRCPIVPDINDNDRHLAAIALTANEHSCVKAVELEPYHPLGLRKYACVGSRAAYTRNEKMNREVLAAMTKKLRTMTVKKVLESVQ